MLALMVVGVAGCRDTDPPPTYFRNLGTDAAPLLPTGSVWKNPAIAQGKAEWRPFRELGDAAPNVIDTPTTGRDAQQDNSEIQGEIRALIQEYNEVVVDGTVDDLLDYYVEQQIDAVGALLQTATTVAGALEELRRELEGKMAEEGERIAAASGVLQSSVRLKLQAESVTVTGDSEATAAITSGILAPTCRFVLVDDEWYMELPDAEVLSQRKPELDLAVSTYRGWLENLRGGQATPEDILQRLEAAASSAEAASRSAEQSDAPLDAEMVQPDDSSAGQGDGTGEGD